MTQSLMLSVALMLSVCLAPGQQGETKDLKPRTVSVRGVGTITTAPDQVRVNVQVNTRAESATSAMSEASRRTRDILALLRNLGVETKDIQTSRVSVAPVYDYEKRIQPPPIIGYTGTNEFSVAFKGKLMEKLGEFLDKSVAAGASSFSNLMYESSRQREQEREALKKAALDAQARAEVLARELGATLGKVWTISESVTGGPWPLARGVMTDAASTGAPVLTGELTITAQVEVVFELR